MSSVVKNILFVLLAVVAGMLFLSLGHMVSNMILPPPAGMDVSNMESFKANAHLLTSGHWALALLSHALGPLIGGAIIGRFAHNPHRPLVWIIGLAFLIAGVLNLYSIPHPLWFKIADIAMYIPMAFLGWKLGVRGR